MKTILCAGITLALASGAWAATTINATNKFACGANLGWMNFENLGAPKVDLVTGKLDGFMYSARSQQKCAQIERQHHQKDNHPPSHHRRHWSGFGFSGAGNGPHLEWFGW
jgi:hypothetical protein